jgi:hypothetical protein
MKKQGDEENDNTECQSSREGNNQARVNPVVRDE